MKSSRLLALTLLLLIILGFISYAPHISKSAPQNHVKGLKYRKITLYNPFPFTLRKIFTIEINFSYGEAVSKGIMVLEERGGLLNFQLWDVEVYSNSEYLKRCKISILVELEPFSDKSILIAFTPTPLPPDLRSVLTEGFVFNSTSTGEILVSTDYYTFSFGNSTSPKILVYNASLNGSWIEFTSPIELGWTVVLKNSTVLSEEDFNITVNIVVNGSLISIVNVNAYSPAGLKIEFNFTFNSFSPFITVDYSIENGVDLKSIYVPLFRLSTEYDKMILPDSSTVNIVSSTPFTLYPPTRFFTLSSPNLPSLGIAFIGESSLENFRPLLEKYNQTLINASRKLPWSKLKPWWSLLNYLSRIYYSEHLPALNITTLTSTLTGLRQLLPLAQQLFSINITNDLSLLENTTLAKRIVGDRYGLTTFIAFQLNETTYAANGLKSTILMAIPLIDQNNFKAKLLASLMGVNTVIVTPFTAFVEAPEEAEVDEAFEIKIVLKTFKSLENITLELDYPVEGFEILGNRSIILANVSSNMIYNYTWKLIPRLSGEYSLNVNIVSSKGDITITSTINVTIPPLYPLPEKVKTHNITVEVVRLDGQPIFGRLVKLINVLENTTTAVGATDENGTVSFLNIPEGVYLVQVWSDTAVENKTIILDSNKNIKLTLKLQDLEVYVKTPTLKPIPGVLVQIYDTSGELIFAGITGSKGELICRNLPIGNYTISVQFFGRIVNTMTVDLLHNPKVEVFLEAFRLTLKVVREKDKPLPLAEVEVRSVSQKFRNLVITNRTNMNGTVVFFLPKGRYVVSISKGQYTSLLDVELDKDMVLLVKSSKSNTLWILSAITAVLWSGFTFYWYRSTSMLRKEEERYKELLSRLEEYYSKGLVEEKLYLKLKNEYEEKLRRIRGGR
ncbi:MAG: hypothetical protein DRJ47_04900 [Thermoprotei archaeon]|nr:MAG: hypothetical protein DRJ47_04900 [Thermoprotei archaeon]